MSCGMGLMHWVATEHPSISGGLPSIEFTNELKDAFRGRPKLGRSRRN